MPVGQALEVYVRVDHPGQRPAAKADHLRAATSGRTSPGANGQDSTVQPCSHLRLATREKHASRIHRP